MRKDYIVSGKRNKRLPLRVVVFVDSNNAHSMKEYEKELLKVKNYVEQETSWLLFIGFKKCGLCINGWVGDSNPREFDHLTDEYRAFDIVIALDHTQVETNKVEELLSNEKVIPTPIFCIDKETIVSERASEIYYELVEKCEMRKEGYYA